jgi:hypothetical protein
MFCYLHMWCKYVCCLKPKSGGSPCPKQERSPLGVVNKEKLYCLVVLKQTHICIKSRWLQVQID